MHSADSEITSDLLAAVERGEEQAVNQLLDCYRSYLKRIVDVRLDPQLRGRLDPSDVVQETLVVASRRIQEFVERRPTSFRIWLRRKALDQLVDQRRFHRRQIRDIANEVAINDPASMSIALALSGSVSRDAMKHELMQQVQTAMENLSESDREMLLLRHAEGLSNAEAAEVLGIGAGAASARYGRAVLRLSTELRRQGVRED